MQTRVIRSPRRRKTIEARIVDGELVVRIPDTMSKSEERRAVAELTSRVERKSTSKHIDLDERARSLANHYGLPTPTSITFSSRQKHRWGSCTPLDGSIRISDRLIGFPPWVLDYVVVHELAHLVESGHTPGFWELVDRYELAERARGYLLAKSGE